MLKTDFARNCAKGFAFAVMMLFIATEAYAGTIFSYPRLYSGPRALGMGNAYTAVGQDAEGVFYNPATLHDMSFNISINAGGEVDQTAIDIATDLFDALGGSGDQTTAVMGLISANTGKPLHLRINGFPRVAWKSFVIGGFAQLTQEARLHNPLGSQGAMEVKSINGGGVVTGFSLPISSVEGLRIGAGYKYMGFASFESNIGIDQITGTADMPEASTKVDMAFDFGVLYDINKGKLGDWNSQLGVSVMNITDVQYSDTSSIPMTLNVGIAMRPEMGALGTPIIALDFHDLLFAYEQDKSIVKRLHAGAEFGFLNNHLSFRAGLNQGYIGGGVGLDLWILKAIFAAYTEEMGAYAGQDPDTRYVLELVAGW